MPTVRAFISHISEDKETGGRLKQALARDFLGLLDVFLSSDTQSIAAGEEWLDSIEKALQESAILMVLCSPESIRKPWINFEAGAAWMRKIPIVPICHAGLEVRDLPMPLSLRQGIAIDDPPGLERLYERIAKVLSCNRPAASFATLAGELTGSAGARSGQSHQALEQLDADRAIRHRLEQALNHPDYKWRSIASVAAEAGLSEEGVADLLRADDRVRFSIGKSGNRIVGWTSRIGAHR
jgi:hypothetical protein